GWCRPARQPIRHDKTAGLVRGPSDRSKYCWPLVLAAVSGPPKDSWGKDQERIESNRRCPPLLSGSELAGRLQIATQDSAGVERRPLPRPPKQSATAGRGIERVLRTVSS